ncbi:MAG: HlyD family efflux transporter periplasmic adaptor subunit [Gammaproteobacteria bacterium]|nr:HlyD family efflux transporter periplasmic adaptor subunit [Gammaproteobacteria bacterium]
MRHVAFALFAALLVTACAQQNDEDPLRLSGTVEVREVDLSFRVGGRLVERRVDEGQPVEAGAVVARLDPEPYRLAVQRARAEAQAAEARLAALRAGTRVQELRAAEAAQRSAQQRLAFARAEEARVADIAARNLASQQDLERARLERQVARAQLDEADERLALLREGPRAEDIAGAEAEWRARVAAVELAAQQLDDATLVSPVGGVVSVRLAETGEMLQAGQPILRVAALDAPWVRAFLPETWLSRVRLGQAAEVRVDGLPDTVFPGRLSFISPEAEFTPRTVETQELRTDLVYRVTIDVSDAQGRLKRGMPADVYLDTAP